MIVMPFARASFRSFWIAGIVSAQRGRACGLQVCLTMSITSRAFVLMSTVTGLSAGGGGAFAFAHSSMMFPAIVGEIAALVAAATIATTAPMTANRLLIVPYVDPSWRRRDESSSGILCKLLVG